MPLNLLLFEKLAKVNSEQEKQSLLNKIIRTPPPKAEHIDLVGEYDFSDGKDYDPRLNINIS